MKMRDKEENKVACNDKLLVLEVQSIIIQKRENKLNILCI